MLLPVLVEVIVVAEVTVPLVMVLVLVKTVLVAAEEVEVDELGGTEVLGFSTIWPPNEGTFGEVALPAPAARFR